MPAKIVNEDAGLLDKRGVLGFFAGKPAPTVGGRVVRVCGGERVVQALWTQRWRHICCSFLVWNVQATKRLCFWPWDISTT